MGGGGVEGGAAVTAGATGMLSTLTGKLAEERKVLAVEASLSCCARALVAAMAASGFANSMVKLRRTLAAAMFTPTALRGTPDTVATLERSDMRTSEVRSATLPAMTISMPTNAAVGARGGAGYGIAGEGEGGGGVGEGGGGEGDGGGGEGEGGGGDGDGGARGPLESWTVQFWCATIC